MPKTEEGYSTGEVLSFALMKQLEALDESIGRSISSAVSKATGQRQHAELVTAILSKPYVSIPDELGIVANLKPSATYALVQDPDFPPTVRIGRSRFLKVANWFAYLDRKEAESSAKPGAA